MRWPSLAAAEEDSTATKALGRGCFAWLAPCLSSVKTGQ